MFADWLTSRGGDGSIEIKQAGYRIEHLIISKVWHGVAMRPALMADKLSSRGREFGK